MKPYLNKVVPYFPVFLFLLNIWLKCLHLTAAAIGHDEPFSIYHAQLNINTLLEQLNNYNNPPLFEIILHFWIKLFGISPLSVRLLPAIFASLCPVLLYYFAKRNFSLRVGIISSLLLTFSDLLLYYSHDCRVYSLFTLLSLLSVYYYLEVINGTKRMLWEQILFISTSTLLIYAHYFGFFVLFFQGAHLLFLQRKQLLKMSINYLAVLVLYLPCIFNMIARLGVSIKGTWLGPPSGIESLYNMLWAFSNAPVVTVIGMAILLFALIKSIINKGYLRLEENSVTVLILFWFLIPFLGMFFISYWVPMYISRYLIFILPAYYILLVLGVETLVKKAIYCNIILAGLVLAFAFTNKLNPDKKQPVFEVMNNIKSYKDNNTLVVIGSYDFIPTIAYHYNQTYFSSIADRKEYHLTDSLLRTDNIYCTHNAEEIKPLLTGKFNKIIYLGFDEKSNSPDYPILNAINVSCSLQKQEEFENSNWRMNFYTWPKK